MESKEKGLDGAYISKANIEKLDPARQSVYNRLVMKCERNGCSMSYMIKNRNKHLEKCNSFVQFKCVAPICKILMSK